MGLLPRSPAAALRPDLRGHLIGTYLIALGSNRRHVRHGAPRAVLSAALDALEREGIEVLRASSVIESAPVGPSQRRYANGAAVVSTDLEPEELLRAIKGIEREFGRRPGGQRWTSRVLDLDIVLWSGGAFVAPCLTVPHPLFRQRPFVLVPALAVAPDWRDPVTGRTVRQLHSRLMRQRASGA